MKGYYRDPQATEAAFTRGWMRTGDLGYFDEDGFLFIVDRKAFVIPQPGATLNTDEIIDFVKERVAAYKYPRVVEFRSEVAHGPTGKILKTELR